MIVGPLAAGGMGDVYRAHEARLNRHVAALRSFSLGRPAVVGIATAIVVLAAGALCKTRHAIDRGVDPAPAGVATAAPPRVLAVLPFTDISRDAEGYFAAGMTEEVMGQLSKLSGLRVMSRAEDPRRGPRGPQKSLSVGADWPLAFMQNAAVHALRGQTAAALDELDRAYAAG